MRKTFFFLSSLISILFIVGCGNPPQPYSKNIENNYPDISLKEKQEILNFLVTLNTIPPFYTKNDGCIYFNDAWYSFKYINKFRNCFIIKSNKIIRVDKSRCSNDYGRHFGPYCDYIGGRSDKYSSFINKIQQHLYLDFIKQLKSYSIFKRTCIRMIKEREKKFKQIKIHILDTTKLLPSNIINNIKAEVYLPEISCLKEYLNTLTLRTLNKNKERIPICLRIDNPYYVDRYLVYLNKDRVCKFYQNFPNLYKIFIKSVKFNFLPNKFIAKNKDIEVIIDNDEKQLTIYNDSDQFIEVNSIVLYYGNIVSSRIFPFNRDSTHLKLKVPPKSFISKKIDFPRIKFIKLKTKEQMHQYGVSISYKKFNENIMRTLFEVKNFSIKDFKN